MPSEASHLLIINRVVSKAVRLVNDFMLCELNYKRYSKILKVTMPKIRELGKMIHQLV